MYFNMCINVLCQVKEILINMRPVFWIQTSIKKEWNFKTGLSDERDSFRFSAGRIPEIFKNTFFTEPLQTTGSIFF